MQYLYVSQQSMDPRVKPEDGVFLPEGSMFIAAGDRSFRFGDGIFDTVLVANGRIYDFESHIERLSNGLKFFRIDLDISGLRDACRKLVEKNNLKNGYVRVVVSRGVNKAAVGYMPASDAAYYIVMTVETPYPVYKQLTLGISPHRASLHVPCKVNSAMLYTLSMLEAREQGWDNALILDAHDHVCETASGNVFWVKDNVMYTPDLSLPFVPGTMRKKVIELSKMPVKEGRYTISDLAKADEIFMSNVACLATPIKAIEGVDFTYKSDEVTKRIRAAIDADITLKTQAQR